MKNRNRAAEDVAEAFGRTTESSDRPEEFVTRLVDAGMPPERAKAVVGDVERGLSVAESVAGRLAFMDDAATRARILVVAEEIDREATEWARRIKSRVRPKGHAGRTTTRTTTVETVRE